MIARRTHVTSLFIVLSALIVCSFLNVGCTSSKDDSASGVDIPAEPTVAQSYSSAAREAGEPSETDVSPDPEASSADILARKAESYAQTLAPLIDQRSAPANGQASPESDVARQSTAEAQSGGLAPATSNGPSEAVATEGHDIGDAARSTNPTIDADLHTAPATPAADHLLAANHSGSPQNHSQSPQANATGPEATKVAIHATSAVAPNSITLNAASQGTDTLPSKLAQRIKDDPLDPAAHLDFQLMRFLRGESTPEVSSLALLPQEDQQMLTVLLDGLTNYRSQLVAEENPLLSRKVKPLLDMADRLRSSSDLDIQKLVVCREVKAFGVYEPIEPARLVATKDKDYPIKIYCEVANFSSQLNDRSIWETRLQYSASLFTDTENGIEVWQGKPAEVLDMCRNRRKDFFILDEVSLPSALTIGGYLFKVTIVDQQANRVAEASVPIQIVAR